MASKKFVQSTKRETLIIVGLYVLFFAWWYLTAYGFGDDPSQYRFVFGFPEWFFYSCIVGYIGISILLWLCVRFFFSDLPLDDVEGEEVKKNER